MARQLAVAEPSQLSAVKSLICTETVRHCVDYYGRDLQSLVLTGSVAREEATFADGTDGSKILGDAEFLLIFKEAACLPPLCDVDRLQHEIESSLLRNGLDCAVSLSAGHPNYLRKLPRHIFTYELLAYGEVIWGDANVLSLIPSFLPSEISLEDAWCTLCNRMVEQLEVITGLHSPTGALPQPIYYRTVKLWLDMTTSLLVFAGAYEPTYRQRAERVQQLAASGSLEDCPFSLSEFSQQAMSCTQWKLGLIDKGPEATWGFWQATLEYARMLWRWELQRLTGTTGRAADKRLLECWSDGQALSRRMRGWLFVLRRQGWLRGLRFWPRWAHRAWRGTPRYWIYAAASELLFRVPAIIFADSNEPPAFGELSELERYLPLIRKPSPGEHHAGWRHLAAEIAWNYHEFLEGTRA